VRWRIAAGQRLRHRAWQDEYVVYNDLSGDTHLLSQPAWELLAALRDGPMAARELAARLALSSEELDELGQLLATLRELGLVDRPC
jgi:PqqD family protein of HPr-rel-A system